MILRRLLLLLLLACSARAAASRLAIIGANAAADEPAQLLTVELSKTAGIVTLERDQIERILAEQSLSKTQVTNALRAGQLLGADGLLFLEAAGAPPNQTLNIRLAAVREGAVLYALKSARPTNSLDQWAANISPTLASTAARLAADKSKLIRLSPLNLRSVTATSASELLDRELTSLLLTRLFRETNILILERSKLIDLTTEKTLAARTEEFLTGAYLLDGIVNKDGFSADTVAISARLIAPDKSATPIEVKGPRHDLATLIDTLVQTALRSLKVAPAAAWNPQNEARVHAEEATWALRWNMLPEAQAAADSAWALGLKNREVATTRLLAHVRDHGKPMFSARRGGGIALSQFSPSDDKLRAALRAALIAEELLQLDPDAPASDPVYKALCETLLTCGDALGMCYLLVEARAGREDTLAEMRRVCRELQSRLLKHPAIRAKYWNVTPAPYGQLPNESDFYNPHLIPNILTVSATHSVYFHETPEGPLPIYRDLIESSCFGRLRFHITHRTAAPPLGGWKWSDRKRHVEVWNKFLEELVASTNFFTHIEGRLLQLPQQTEWSDFVRLHESILDELDKNWDRVLARGLRFNFQFLDSKAFHADDTPSEEAKALDLKMEDFQLEHGEIGGINGRKPKGPVRGFYDPAKIKRPQPASIEKGLESAPLTISKYWRGAEYEYGRTRAWLSAAVYRQGRLWFRYMGPALKPDTFTALVSLDLSTMSADEIIPLDRERFPNTGMYSLQFVTDFTHLPKSFEVVSNEVFIAESTNLTRFNLKTRQWSAQPSPLANPDIYSLSGQLYLSGQEAIYQLIPGGEAKLLASVRRRPAATLLDELPALEYPRLFADAAGGLRAIAAGRPYAWNGSQWKSLSDRTNTFVYVSDQGASMQTEPNGPAGNISFLRPNADTLETVADSASLSGEILFRARPFFFGLNTLALCNAASPNGGPASSAFYLFDAGERPVRIPLKFEAPNAPPFDPLPIGYRRPWLVETPEGLAFGHSGVPGVWFAPRADIRQAIASARAARTKP